MVSTLQQTHASSRANASKKTTYSGFKSRIAHHSFSYQIPLFTCRNVKQLVQKHIAAFVWMAAAADKELTKVLNRELANRDKRWVLNGKVPEVELENKLAKKNAYPHEIEQAKRLSQHGIKCTFQVDYDVDKKTKGTARQKIICKTDLANGLGNIRSVESS